jgi:hypothetical protein
VLTYVGDGKTVIGTVAKRGWFRVEDATRARVVLKRGKTFFSVLTAFPEVP